MIWITLNVGGLIDPLEESILNKYSSDSIKIISKAKEVEDIDGEPFFSDRWLLRCNGSVIRERDGIHTLLGKDKCDIVITCEDNDTYKKAVDKVSEEVRCILTAIESKKKYNRFLEGKPEPYELTEYVKELRDIKAVNAYKLSDKYLMTYVKWVLLFKGTDGMDVLESWEASKTAYLEPREAMAVAMIASRVKGNERDIRNLLELHRGRKLTEELARSICNDLPERTYVTAKNYMLYILQRDKRKRKDVMNLVYNYRYKVSQLRDGGIEICERFEYLFKEYITGKLSRSTRQKWLGANGKQFKISSEYLLEKWLDILESVSLERVLRIKFSLLQNSDAEIYSMLVMIIDKTLV